jgi:hypothetical protein
MNKRRVFRIQPQAYACLQQQAAERRLSKSVLIRQRLAQACTQPPQDFPRRGLKPDLKAVCLFMDDHEHRQLQHTSARCRVSNDLFVEAALAQASAAPSS